MHWVLHRRFCQSRPAGRDLTTTDHCDSSCANKKCYFFTQKKKCDGSKKHLRGDIKNRLFMTFLKDLAKKFSKDCQVLPLFFFDQMLAPVLAPVDWC